MLFDTDRGVIVVLYVRGKLENLWKAVLSDPVTTWPSLVSNPCHSCERSVCYALCQMDKLFQHYTVIHLVLLGLRLRLPSDIPYLNSFSTSIFFSDVLYLFMSWNWERVGWWGTIWVCLISCPAISYSYVSDTTYFSAARFMDSLQMKTYYQYFTEKQCSDFDKLANVHFKNKQILAHRCKIVKIARFLNFATQFYYL